MALGRLSADRERSPAGLRREPVSDPAAGPADGRDRDGGDRYIMMEAMPQQSDVPRHHLSDLRPRPRATSGRASSSRSSRTWSCTSATCPPNTRGWKGVFLADTRKPGETQLLTADRGHFVLEPAQRRVDLILEDGILHRSVVDTPAQYELQQFEALTVQLDPETVFPRQGPAPGDNEITIPSCGPRLGRCGNRACRRTTRSWRSGASTRSRRPAWCSD